jgi:hypothetical protein
MTKPESLILSISFLANGKPYLSSSDDQLFCLKSKYLFATHSHRVEKKKEKLLDRKECRVYACKAAKTNERVDRAETCTAREFEELWLNLENYIV